MTFRGSLRVLPEPEDSVFLGVNSLFWEGLIECELGELYSKQQGLASHIL